jgi:hypothetical protein
MCIKVLKSVVVEARKKCSRLEIKKKKLLTVAA